MQRLVRGTTGMLVVVCLVLSLAVSMAADISDDIQDTGYPYYPAHWEQPAEDAQPAFRPVPDRTAPEGRQSACPAYSSSDECDDEDGPPARQALTVFFGSTFFSTPCRVPPEAGTGPVPL